MRDLERLLKAVANRRRLAILRYLKGHREAAVGDIVSEIKASFKATSKHLSILSAAALVEREQRRLQGIYRLAPVRVALVRHLLNLL